MNRKLSRFVHDAVLPSSGYSFKSLIHNLGMERQNRETWNWNNSSEATNIYFLY